jgi:hypothetical protein
MYTPTHHPPTIANKEMYTPALPKPARSCTHTNTDTHRHRDTETQRHTQAAVLFVRGTAISRLSFLRKPLHLCSCSFTAFAFKKPSCCSSPPPPPSSLLSSSSSSSSSHPSSSLISCSSSFAPAPAQGSNIKTLSLPLFCNPGGY